MMRNGLIKRAFAPLSHRISTIPPALELLALMVVVFALLLPTGVHGSAASDFLTMPALGRNDFPLGALYDATTDRTIPYKLWDEAYIANYTFIERVNREQYKFMSGDSYRAAWDMFDMDAELKMSFMCGLLSVKGSAALFKEKCASHLVQRVSMMWQHESAWKSIRMEALFEHPERMYRKVLETGATHVIVKVEYGASYTLSFEAEASNEADASEIAGSLDVVVRSIPGFAIEGKASLELSESQKEVANSLTVRSSGDVILPAPVTSYESAKQACQNLVRYFKQTFNIGDDGMAIGGGNPGNPLIVVMAPLKDFMDGARNLMYKISDDIVNEAVEVVERMDDILKRCSTKMTFMDDYLKGAFPRLTKEMQSFYNMIDEFKAQTERSIQALLPKLRSGVVEELQLSSVVSEANRRLDLADPDGWLELKDQQAAQFRGILDMLPRPVDDEDQVGCQLTKQAQDWVVATGFDDDHTVAIVLDFPVNQFLKPMRSVLFDPVVNESTMGDFGLRRLSLGNTTIAQFKDIRFFVEKNAAVNGLRSIFIDRLSFPLVEVPPVSGSLKFHFYSGGEVLCPAFTAPAAPTMISVGLPAPNTTNVTLFYSAGPSCLFPTGFTIRITVGGLENKTIEAPAPLPSADLSNLTFVVDVHEIAQRGVVYGFSIRANYVAGFSKWSNEVLVVLQPTPAPLGRDADWNQLLVRLSAMNQTQADLFELVASVNNDTRKRDADLDARINSTSKLVTDVRAALSRYDGSVVLQRLMDVVTYTHEHVVFPTRCIMGFFCSRALDYWIDVFHFPYLTYTEKK